MSIHYTRPARIISGGQTGADQGGLRAALLLGIPTGGYAPKGFKTESGTNTSLAFVYKLTECTGDYSERTRLNVKTADGIALFSPNLKSPGTKLTIKLANQYDKPMISNPHDGNFLHLFCVLHNIQTLMIAGNRESKSPGIEELTFQIVKEAFEKWIAPDAETK